MPWYLSSFAGNIASRNLPSSNRPTNVLNNKAIHNMVQLRAVRLVLFPLLSTLNAQSSPLSFSPATQPLGHVTPPERW